MMAAIVVLLALQCVALFTIAALLARFQKFTIRIKP